ncbi:MAG TPA: RNA helicase [Maribacter sp.]|nr:RNA helicase [Maribacter sp.]
MIKLRQWQEKCKQKALNWYEKNKHFLINAAPASGKTIAACVIANDLIERGLIDRVIIIAPRTKVLEQWCDDFYDITGRYIGKVTSRDGDLENFDTDVCATWAAIQGMQDAIQAMCKSSRVLTICDEHHHAAVEATWGRSAYSGFADAKFALILTGTPIRSDGSESTWLAYDDCGAIAHPEEGTYTLTYGEAVTLGYCRPATFHRHVGRFNVKLDNQEIVVASHEETEIPNELNRHPGLQTALNFFRLARKPLYQADNTTPIEGNYQQTMIEDASAKLTEIRNRLPNAGGLVIAPDIEMAKYFVKVIEKVEGEKPMIVHSFVSSPDQKIAQFRRSDKRWLVSVAMVSEGVDIPRLRVLAYLPNSQTELSFRQAMGRVVRSYGPKDDSYAYVVMPSFDMFDRYASRVEGELPPTHRGEPATPRTKVCPVCHAECSLMEKICPECHHEFTPSTPPPDEWKQCSECGALNPIRAESCQTCGASFTAQIELSLEEALRDGVITRGMQISEDEAIEAEEIAPYLRKHAFASGDTNIIRALKTLPDQSYKRLGDMFDLVKKDRNS